MLCMIQIAYKNANILEKSLFNKKSAQTDSIANNSVAYSEEVKFSSLPGTEEEKKFEGIQNIKESSIDNSFFANLSFKKKEPPVRRQQRKRELKA